MKRRVISRTGLSFLGSLVLAACASSGAATKSGAERTLTKEVTVPAKPADVWAAWTTVDGVKTFFAPDAKIEPAAGGAFEIYFDPSQPAGMKGSEGCTVIEVDPEKKLTFTWNFPPTLASIRNEHTQVTITLEPKSGGDKTHVTLVQSGWKEGEDWDKGFEYFDKAWGMVLERLEKRFATGQPLDWSKM